MLVYIGLFLAKTLVTATDYLLALATLSDATKNRNDPIYRWRYCAKLPEWKHVLSCKPIICGKFSAKIIETSVRIVFH